MQTSDWLGHLLLQEAENVVSREAPTSLQSSLWCSRHNEQVWKRKLNSRTGQLLFLHMTSNRINALKKTSLYVPQGDQVQADALRASVRQKQEPKTPSSVNKQMGSEIGKWLMPFIHTTPCPKQPSTRLQLSPFPPLPSTA